MSPEIRAFLEHVRHAEDPSAEDEQRVLEAVRTTIAAGALVGVASVAGSKWLKLMAAWGMPGLKMGPAVLCVLAAAATFDVPSSREHAPPRAMQRALQRAQSQSESSARPPSSLATPSAVKPAPSPVRARSAPAMRAAQEPAPNAPSVSRPPSLRHELRLLSDVQRLLQEGDASAALQRLDAHETGDRELAAERRAARILALCAAGRTEEARQAATDFLSEHPTSLQRAAIVRSCAGER